MKTKRGILRVSSLILVIALCSSIFAAITSYPKPTPYKYVNDYGGLLNAKTKNQIIMLGNELEQRTGAQAIVVTINSLDNVPIEDYANGLFRNWGIGQASKDNGLLLLLVPNDKAWRVEVGRGLEGAIPDALSNRIMTEVAKPRFIDGNYGQGLLESYSVFCDQIASEYGITLTHSMGVTLPQAQSYSSRYGIWVIIILLVIDLLFNRGRISSFMLQTLLWSSFFGRGGPRGGGGGASFGGFGGGSSNGGGSSGGW